MVMFVPAAGALSFGVSVVVSTSRGVFVSMAVSFRWKISKTSSSLIFRVAVFMLGETKDPPSPTRTSPRGVIRRRTVFVQLPRDTTSKFSTTPTDQASPYCGVEPLDRRWNKMDDSPSPAGARIVSALLPALDTSRARNVLMPPTSWSDTVSTYTRRPSKIWSDISGFVI